MCVFDAILHTSRPRCRCTAARAETVVCLPLASQRRRQALPSAMPGCCCTVAQTHFPSLAGSKRTSLARATALRPPNPTRCLDSGHATPAASARPAHAGPPPPLRGDGRYLLSRRHGGEFLRMIAKSAKRAGRADHVRAYDARQEFSNA